MQDGQGELREVLGGYRSLHQVRLLRDTKFEERIADFVLFRNLDGKYLTLKEYEEKHEIKGKDEAVDQDGASVEAEVVSDTDDQKDAAGEAEAEKPKATIFYVTDEVQQAQYIQMFRKSGKDAVVLKENIDQPFIQQLEQKNEHIRFARIDSELAEDFTGERCKRRRGGTDGYLPYKPWQGEARREGGAYERSGYCRDHDRVRG